MAVDVLKAWRQHLQIGDLGAESGNAAEDCELFGLRAGQVQKAADLDRAGKAGRDLGGIAVARRDIQSDRQIGAAAEVGEAAFRNLPPLRQDQDAVGPCLDLGQGVAAEEDRGAIEAEFGEPLEWETLDDKRACRVATYRTGSIDDPANVLNEVREWSVDRLLRFKRVFGPRLRRASA